MTPRAYSTRLIGEILSIFLLLQVGLTSAKDGAHIEASAVAAENLVGSAIHANDAAAAQDVVETGLPISPDAIPTAMQSATTATPPPVVPPVFPPVIPPVVKKSAPAPAPAPAPPKTQATKITESGEYALWAGFFGMFVPFLWFARKMYQLPDGRRQIPFYTMMVNAIASVAYLVMATGYGDTVVDDRQFFYMRYIDWFFTTPLLLLDLCALAKASADTTYLLVGFDVLMIITGVIGAFLTGAEEAYKPWAFFAFAMCFFLPIVYNLGFAMPAAIETEEVQRIFGVVSWLTVLSWSVYPVVWVLAEGTHYVTPDIEVILYTVIDLLSKSVFGIVLLSSHHAIDIVSFEPEEKAPLVSTYRRDLEDPAKSHCKSHCCM